MQRGGNQLSKAEAHLQRAVELARSNKDPQLADILWLRADFYHQVQLPDRQTRLLMRYDLEELLSIQPKYPGANVRLGSYFDALAEFDRAIEHLEREIALADEGIAVDVNFLHQAHHLLAIIYSDHQGNPPKALHHATAVKQIKPGPESERLNERVLSVNR